MFVSQIDYVSNAPGAYSTKLSTNLTQADLRNYILGDILTIRTGYPNGWNGGTGDPQKIDGSYKRPYFLRFGARTSKSFSSIKRYNFTDVKEVWVGNEKYIKYLSVIIVLIVASLPLSAQDKVIKSL